MTQPDASPQFSTAEFEPTLQDGPQFFMRGLLFGAGAAVLGLILYSAVGIITGYEIGFVSLAVGYIVGKGVVMGSRGRTGRRYQIVAALLTYFSVSVATVPIGIVYLIKNPDAQTAQETPSTTTTTPPAAESTSEEPAQPVNWALAIGTLFLIGLASPFLQLTELPGGLISLFILGIGVHLAWKITGDRTAQLQAAIAGQNPEEKPTTLDLGR